jgi:hypothetical protein
MLPGASHVSFKYKSQHPRDHSLFDATQSTFTEPAQLMTSRVWTQPSYGYGNLGGEKTDGETIVFTHL